MIDDIAVSALLTELSSIANAAMTADQREKRAAPVLAAAGVTVADVMAALSQPHLTWNIGKAGAYGIDIVRFLEGMHIICTDIQTVPQLLDCIHRIEAAAAMLKAGYTATRDTTGKLAWSR